MTNLHILFPQGHNYKKINIIQKNKITSTALIAIPSIKR